MESPWPIAPQPLGVRAARSTVLHHYMLTSVLSHAFWAWTAVLLVFMSTLVVGSGEAAPFKAEPGARDHQTVCASRLAVVVATTESAVDWARLAELLPLWSITGREACASAVPWAEDRAEGSADNAVVPMPLECGAQPNLPSRARKGGSGSVFYAPSSTMAAAQASTDPSAGPRADQPYHDRPADPTHRGADRAASPNLPRLVVYTPGEAMGRASQRRFRAALGRAGRCFQQSRPDDVSSGAAAGPDGRYDPSIYPSFDARGSGGGVGGGGDGVEFVGCGLSASEDGYPRGPNAMWCVSADSRRWRGGL